MSDYFLPKAARPTVSDDLAAEAWVIALALEAIAEGDDQHPDAALEELGSLAARPVSPR
jgi:hypothetical protein